jgi:hypothetical protein
MSDKIASTPPRGPTLYDFGAATPGSWPQGWYVPKDVYDDVDTKREALRAALLRLKTAVERYDMFAPTATGAEHRHDEMMAALDAAQGALDSRLCPADGLTLSPDGKEVGRWVQGFPDDDSSPPSGSGVENG